MSTKDTHTNRPKPGRMDVCTTVFVKMLQLASTDVEISKSSCILAAFDWSAISAVINLKS